MDRPVTGSGTSLPALATFAFLTRDARSGQLRERWLPSEPAVPKDRPQPFLHGNALRAGSRLLPTLLPAPIPDIGNPTRLSDSLLLPGLGGALCGGGGGNEGSTGLSAACSPSWSASMSKGCSRPLLP